MYIYFINCFWKSLKETWETEITDSEEENFLEPIVKHNKEIKYFNSIGNEWKDFGSRP